MKIGKISSFGTLLADGKWYSQEYLYRTNRIYYVHSGKARYENFVFEAGRVYFIPESPAFDPVAEDGEPFVHSYADFSLIFPIKCNSVISTAADADEELGVALGVFLLGCKQKERLKHEEYKNGFYTLFETAISLIVTKIAECNGADFVFDETVTRALSIMNDRMNEDLTVSALAEEVYMSEDGFIRRFSRIMGATPYAYLKKLRLTTAAGMINDGEPISTAALAVGYSDAASLIHAMSKEKQKTKNK